MTFIVGLVILGILIVIHEFGHFLAAKLTGVKVFEFAVGFGPKLLSHRFGETIFSLRIIPLGGFVSLAGMDETNEEVESERSFANKSYLQKIFIISAGPLANFLTAILFVWLTIFIFGEQIPNPAPVIGDVVSFSPAQKAGFKRGDLILSVNEIDIKEFKDIAPLIQSSNGVIKFRVKRDNQILELYVEPIVESEAEAFLRDEKATRKLIGLVAQFDYKKVKFGDSWEIAFQQTVITSATILKAVYGLVTSKISKKELAGPLTIISEAGANVKRGLRSVLIFMFILSVNLALLNLLPIPLLDGGHIIVISVESLLHRSVPHFIKSAINFLGLAFLLFLTLFVLKNDIKRLFF
ncbi:MAG: site-2 protease family protein [Deltaproteobacteria bacterium]|nr:site-2 protease family protein [Deltaproteobacteria bacterium]